MQARAVLSRRAVLGLAALAVAGCSKHHKPIPPPPVVVPDTAALATARTGEQSLLASYDAKIAHASARQRPSLEVQRAIHAAHLKALHGPATSDTDIAVVTNLRQALRVSARQLRSLALSAQLGTNAALLASIAAAHETSGR